MTSSRKRDRSYSETLQVYPPERTRQSITDNNNNSSYKPIQINSPLNFDSKLRVCIEKMNTDLIFNPPGKRLRLGNFTAVKHAKQHITQPSDCGVKSEDKDNVTQFADSNVASLDESNATQSFDCSVSSLDNGNVTQSSGSDLMSVNMDNVTQSSNCSVTSDESNVTQSLDCSVSSIDNSNVTQSSGSDLMSMNMDNVTHSSDCGVTSSDESIFTQSFVGETMDLDVTSCYLDILPPSTPAQKAARRAKRRLQLEQWKVHELTRTRKERYHNRLKRKHGSHTIHHSRKTAIQWKKDLVQVFFIE